MPQNRPLIFQSVRIANIVLLLIIIAAVFGTLPPQLRFLSFSPRAVFRSWWFVSLLIYLAFALGFFGIAKLVHLLKPNHKNLSAAPNGFSFRSVLTLALPSEEAGDLRPPILRAIRAYGYRISQDKDDFASISAEKNKWGVWGSPMIHLGFLIVLIGGLFTFLFADVRDINIHEGETIDLPRTQAKVRLEKFSVVLHPNRREPEEYVSRLLIQDRQGHLIHHDLKVNHPIKVSGTKLFQMRYQVEVSSIELVAYRAGTPLETVSVKVGERKALSRIPLVLQVNEVIPDFAMAPDGTVTSRSPYFKNPAVSVSVFGSPPSTTPTEKIWAFSDLVSHEGTEARRLEFVIQKLRKHHISGIKLSRDPGVGVVYSGFLFLIFGTFISSFVIPRLLTICLVPNRDQHRLTVEILGHKTKDALGFEWELKKLESSIQKISLGTG